MTFDVIPSVAARIFISHSAKDLEPEPAADAGEEALARAARRRYARAVRDKIVEKLEAQGYEVFLDRHWLRPGGEPWEATIHRMLGGCNGAAFLLDEDSVLSRWVLKEATILSWRRSLNTALRLVPVFLGAFVEGDLDRSPLGFLRLSDLNAPRLVVGEEDAERLADEAVEAFAGMSTDTASPAMTKWIRDVADAVSKAGEAHRRDAAIELGVKEDELLQTTGSELDELLAHHLLHLPLEDTLRGLEELARSPALPSESLNRLVRLLIPTWVSASAARSFYGLATAAPPRVPLMINGRRRETGDEYVRRALFGASSTAVPVGWEPLGEVPDTRVLELYEEELAKRWQVPPPREDLQAYVKTYASDQYVLVGEEAMRPRQLEVLREHYPWPTYVLLPGADCSEARAVAPDAVTVTPELEPDVESTIATLRMRAQEIANRA